MSENSLEYLLHEIDFNFLEVERLISFELLVSFLRKPSVSAHTDVIARFFHSLRGKVGRAQRTQIWNFAKEAQMDCFLFTEYLLNPLEVDFLDMIYEGREDIKDMLLTFLFDLSDQGCFLSLQNDPVSGPLQEFTLVLKFWAIKNLEDLLSEREEEVCYLASLLHQEY